MKLGDCKKCFGINCVVDTEDGDWCEDCEAR